MKRLLILGAGRVARPIVRYLLEETSVELTVASQFLHEAEALVAGHPRGTAQRLEAEDQPALDAAVASAEVVISLLPWTHHLAVAKHCLVHKRHLVTASYVSEDMAALDEQARSAGLLFLNELGVDPGIDHMSAMRIIHGVQEAGGTIESFRSYCGGLPAPQHNNNPWGYKFSWSPRGVVLAARNASRYLEDGKVIDVPSQDLFATLRYLTVEGVGMLEAYPNRDALEYVGTYGLKGVQTMYRGTLRYPGHSATWLAMSRAGLFDLDERQGMKDKTLAEFMGSLAGAPAERAKGAFARKSGWPIHSDPIRRLDWLGMFGDDRIGVDTISPLDILSNRLEAKLGYADGELDMIILHHEFIAAQDGKREELTSQLVDFGVPGGDTSMARTVSLPMAIATRLLCEGKIALTGVRIPVDREIYQPVLAGLEQQGIVCQEGRRPLP